MTPWDGKESMFVRRMSFFETAIICPTFNSSMWRFVTFFELCSWRMMYSFWVDVAMCMIFCMFRKARKQFEIFYSIIAFYSINMMNSLFWFKISSKLSFYYKSVLKNITIFPTKFMGWILNKDISVVGFIWHGMSLT